MTHGPHPPRTPSERLRLIAAQARNQPAPPSFSDDEPTTITRVPSDAPPIARGLTAILLTLPPAARAALAALALLLATALIAFALYKGHSLPGL